MKKRVFFYFLSLLFGGILYFQLVFWQSKIFGITFLLTTFYFFGKIWGSIYEQSLSTSHAGISKILGYFTAPLLVGFIMGIFVAWYHISPSIIVLSFFITSSISLEFFFSIKNKSLQDILDVRTFTFRTADPPGFLPGFYIFLWLCTLIGIMSPATEILQSPWQHISVFFLILFFLLTFLLFYLVLSSKRVTLVLFLILLHSTLLHSYLPLSHVNPWGGDVWRMIGLEQRFLNQEPVLPVLFGQDATWQSFYGIPVPHAFMIPNKYVYSHLWGETLFLASVLQIDLLTINRFLVPIFWSLLVPILCFGLGKILFDSERKALLFTFLTFLPFPLQALGGLTLAVSFGTVVFLLELFLWFEYLETKNKILRNFVLLLGVLSLFGYTLYFFLFWYIVVVSVLLQKTAAKKSFGTLILVSFVSIFFFPFIEVFLNTSVFSPVVPWFDNIKQFFGQWSGWFYATLIRPHDILSGNIIFNHTPAFAFVSNIFTDFRWSFVVLMAVLAFFTLNGLSFILSQKKIQVKIIFILFWILFGGYVIGWYILQGERSFTRRLDALLAWSLIVTFCYGIFRLLKKYDISLDEKSVKKFGFFSFFLIFSTSWMITSIFASGPDMRVVSKDEYDMAVVVNREYVKTPREVPCILADTWLLLAVEAVSRRHIVGGGFVMGSNFEQKEREYLYAEVLKNSSIDLESKLHQATNANQCFVIVPKKQKNLTKIREKLGNPTYHNDTLMMWKVGLKS